MSEKEGVIEKARPTRKELVPLRTERGQPRIVTSSRWINEQKDAETQMPRWLCVCDEMYKEASIYNSIDYTNLHVVNSLYNGQFVPGSDTRRSKIATDFLNYNIRNFSYGDWYDAMTNSATDLQYGFSFLNIVLEQKGYGPYARAWTLKKLSPRDQKSIEGWIWNDNFTEFLGFIQKPNAKLTQAVANKFQPHLTLATTGAMIKDLNHPILWREQLLHCRYNARNDNPQGDSPLAHIYQTWKELILIKKYEVIGVSKDLGGSLIVRVPNDLLEKAANPSLYPEEAQGYADLQQDASDLHAGESSYIVLSSETDDNGNFLYDIVFKGVDGGGKQYNTKDIIDQKVKSIYNAFGTSFMLLGQDSVGSYSLASSSMSTHAHYVERSIMQKKIAIEEQLAKRLLIANDIYLDWKDMPRFEPADPTEFDWDVLSKFIQRVKSVEGMTPELLRFLYSKIDAPDEGINKLNFSSKGNSRAGESGGSSGTGTTQAGGANSSLNNENAAISKSFVLEKQDESHIYLIDVEADKRIIVDK